MKSEKTRINAEIEAIEVRVIDDAGEQLGTMSVKEALSLAAGRDLDLVEVAPESKPPVCKIMDWGREKFRKQKVKKHSKKNQTTVQLKEIQLRPVTDTHDVEIKLKNARKFLQKGNKVKFVMRFRGREISHTDVGMALMLDIVAQMEEEMVLESQPRLNGRSIQMIASPK